MDSLAVISVPVLTAWALWTIYRCISATAARVLRPLAILMTLGLMTGIVIGGRAAVIAIAINAVIALAIEMMIGYNVIPSVRRLRPLFDYLPLDLRIFANGPTEIYRTNAARKLDDATFAAIAAHKLPTKSKNVISFRLDTPENEIVKLYRLQSGIAALIESSDEIHQLQLQLENQRNILLRQIAFLERNREMQSTLFRQRRERELERRVENDLRTTTTQIGEMLDDLEANAANLTDEQRLEQLNRVKALVAYCKRKGMLILASAESEKITRDQVESISREAMVDLRSIGIECAVLVDIESEIPITAFNLVYDAIYECTIGVLPRTHPIMLVYLCQIDAFLEARISIECAIGLDSETAIDRIPRYASSTEALTALLTEIVDELDKRLAKRELAYSIELVDNLVSIVLRVGGGRI